MFTPDNQPLNIPTFTPEEIAAETAHIEALKCRAFAAATRCEWEVSRQLHAERKERQAFLDDVLAGTVGEYDRTAPTDDLPENLRVYKEEISIGIFDAIQRLGRKVRG